MFLVNNWGLLLVEMEGLLLQLLLEAHSLLREAAQLRFAGEVRRWQLSLLNLRIVVVRTRPKFIVKILGSLFLHSQIVLIEFRLTDAREIVLVLQATPWHNSLEAGARFGHVLSLTKVVL